MIHPIVVTFLTVIVNVLVVVLGTFGCLAIGIPAVSRACKYIDRGSSWTG